MLNPTDPTTVDPTTTATATLEPILPSDPAPLVDPAPVTDPAPDPAPLVNPVTVIEVDAPWVTPWDGNPLPREAGPWDGDPRPAPSGPWTGSPATVAAAPLTADNVQVVVLGIEVRAQFGIVADGHLSNPKVSIDHFSTLTDFQADNGACVLDAWEQLKQNPNLTVG